jgi:K+-transporting ATPase KdpF subunit
VTAALLALTEAGFDDAVGLVVAVALGVFLVVALVRPERF